MNKLHVKSGDNVMIIAGKDKGKSGRILACSPKDRRVQVEAANLIVVHKKARSAQETGGRIDEIGFLDASNVQIICPACNKQTRVAHSFLDGKKIRMCKHCKESLDIKPKTEKKNKRIKEEKINKDTKDVKTTKVVDKTKEKTETKSKKEKV